MSGATEAVIDLVTANTDFTKMSPVLMRWDGSGSITGFGLNPTLMVNGNPANPVSQVIGVGHLVLLLG